MAAVVAGDALEFFDFVIAAAVRVQTATEGRNPVDNCLLRSLIMGIGSTKKPANGRPDSAAIALNR